MTSGADARVLISCTHLQNTIDTYRHRFDERGIQIDLPPVAQQLRESELMEIIDRYDGVIAGDDQFTKDVLGRATRLRVIVKWGVGVDNIDLVAAERLGIQVRNTPNAFDDEVADVVIGYIVMLARQLHLLDRSVRDGHWLKHRGLTLRGKVLGVIGVGSIGRAVVRRAAALGMTLVGHDLVPPSREFLAETRLQMATFDELIGSADFISLNCNATSENRGMLGAREFARMKQGVRLINTARGQLIDQQALVEALRSGKVAGAALDVVAEEPLPLRDPLRGFDNCIFGTHNSSNTEEAVARVNERSIDNLFAALDSASANSRHES